MSEGCAWSRPSKANARRENELQIARLTSPESVFVREGFPGYLSIPWTVMPSCHRAIVRQLAQHPPSSYVKSDRIAAQEWSSPLFLLEIYLRLRRAVIPDESGLDSHMSLEEIVEDSVPVSEPLPVFHSPHRRDAMYGKLSLQGTIELRSLISTHPSLLHPNIETRVVMSSVRMLCSAKSMTRWLYLLNSLASRQLVG